MARGGAGFQAIGSLGEELQPFRICGNLRMG